ncbi:hypothetical protein J4442_04435 [Candidatus Woesearchaeota archaeon]|nr:hypothetical protein [Candidatus Woesearchaeota archaeon]
MKKYNFFLILVSIFLVFISGCASQKQFELPSELIFPIEEISLLEVKNCENVIHDPEAMPFSKRDLCYYQLAMKYENPSICAKIKSETFDDDCFEVLAERTGDYRVCGQIDPDGKMGLCYLEFLEKMPVGIEFCEYLTYPTHRDSCITKMAVFIPDLDYDICDDVDEFLGMRNTCYKSIALNKNDLEG